jgi:hypothetical protein
MLFLRENKDMRRSKGASLLSDEKGSIMTMLLHYMNLLFLKDGT